MDRLESDTYTFDDVLHALHHLLTAMPRPHDLPGQRCEKCNMWLAQFQIARDSDRLGVHGPYYERRCANCLTPAEKREIDEARAEAAERALVGEEVVV